MALIGVPVINISAYLFPVRDRNFKAFMTSIATALLTLSVKSGRNCFNRSKAPKVKGRLDEQLTAICGWDLRRFGVPAPQACFYGM
jgi:hypothetical protein